ncbi:MAG: hypothetical protein DRQ44_07080 [Gammaproteobacteria bacterium]|nr:MAG: hypothetical protein DRQ44_07080 [Gammaproteobacteria bacterium]
MKSLIKALRKNWAKYLIEALVITFSIIGAFILDNWNEERQNRKEEQTILAGLKEEFLENLDEVTRNIGLNEDVITATYEMIDLLRSEDWQKGHDLIDSLVARIYMFGTFDAQTGISDELISAGKLSLLTDARLKKKLTGWSGILHNAQEDYDIRLQLYSFILIPEFIKYFTLANGDWYMDFSSWSDSYVVPLRGKSPFDHNTSDMNLLEFENILWVHKVNNDFVNLNEYNMKDYIEKTLELIELNIS